MKSRGTGREAGFEALPHCMPIKTIPVERG
jgi:hypothetical protein